MQDSCSGGRSFASTFRPRAIRGRLASGSTASGAIIAFAVCALAGCGGDSSPPPASPTVVSTTPANAATGVLNTAKVSATFDQAIDPATLKNATFSVNCPTGSDPFGSVTYDAATNGLSKVINRLKNCSKLISRYWLTRFAKKLVKKS